MRWLNEFWFASGKGTRCLGRCEGRQGIKRHSKTSLLPNTDTNDSSVGLPRNTHLGVNRLKDSAVGMNRRGLQVRSVATTSTSGNKGPAKQ